MNFVKPTTNDYLRKLITVGACSIHVLPPEEVGPLLAEAGTFEFEQRDRLTKTGVTQNFSGHDTFGPKSPFMVLARDTATLLNSMFDRMISQPIEFNDYSLQKYPVSSPDEQYAISPHLDHKNCINLIAVYVLKGIAPFYICSDRSGADAVEICARPGDLILMRGTGFLNSTVRPYHCVGKVTQERLTFGLRQTVDAATLPKHY